jgi:MFS superfamily sulfate permease-like transporter
MPWYDNPDNPTDPRAAILLTFLSGIVLLLMAVFKLGFLVNYVSHAVITGFTCAAAVIISFSQLKKLLGLKNIGRHFYEAIVDVPMNLKLGI